MAPLWQALVAAGLPLMRVPEDAGGAGLTLFDAVLVAEAAGRHLASAPVAEVIVAAHILARAATEAASGWLDAVGKRGRIVTLVPVPVRAGATLLVPAGAVADGVLSLIEGALTLVEPIGPCSVPANLGSLPVAMMDLADESRGRRHIVLARGDSALLIWQEAIEDWTLLQAAMLAAMARQALDGGGRLREGTLRLRQADRQLSGPRASDGGFGDGGGRRAPSGVACRCRGWRHDRGAGDRHGVLVVNTSGDLGRDQIHARVRRLWRVHGIRCAAVFPAYPRLRDADGRPRSGARPPGRGAVPAAADTSARPRNRAGFRSVSAQQRRIMPRPHAAFFATR